MSKPALRPSFGLEVKLNFSTNSYIERDSAVLTAITYGLIALELVTYEDNNYFFEDLEMHWKPPAPIVPYG